MSKVKNQTAKAIEQVVVPDSTWKLVTTQQFGEVVFQCYQQESYDGSEGKEFWATREQIGQLLEYADPATAIKNIHQRNQDRLDLFSRVAQIELPFGGKQEVVLYNFKGLLEICRFSNQPKANLIIDWLWELADRIRKATFSQSRDQLAELGQEQRQLQDSYKQLQDSYKQLQDSYKQLQFKYQELQILHDIARQNYTRLENSRHILEIAYQQLQDSLKPAPVKLFDEPPVLLGEDEQPVYSISIEQMALILTDYSSRDVQRSILFAWLRENGWLSTEESTWNQPTRKALDTNFLMSVKRHYYSQMTQQKMPYYLPRITRYGVQYFINLCLQGETFGAQRYKVVSRDQYNPLEIIIRNIREKK